MKKLMTICAAVELIMAVTGAAQAALDVNTIIMTSYKSHLDGAAETDPWNFEIWVDFVDTTGLDHINVTKPGGLSSFTIDGGDWEYQSINYPDLAALQVDYPTGEYTFDFRSASSSLLTFELDYSGLSEPTNPVDFTYPEYDGETGISTTPTFTWTIDAGAGNALAMWLDNDADWYENVPVSMDTTSWGPLGPLNPNHTYELEISVINVKNLEPGPAFPTMTVGGDEFKYGLWIEHLNEIEFTTAPEPATICLLGLGALSLISRKKK
jgi:hypothetical protein